MNQKIRILFHNKNIKNNSKNLNKLILIQKNQVRVSYISRLTVSK